MSALSPAEAARALYPAAVAAVAAVAQPPAPPAAPVLVFCDVDETLIDCKSLFDFLDFYLSAKYGGEGTRQAERTRRDLAAMTAAGVPREEANRAYYRIWAGESAVEVVRAGVAWWGARSADPDFLIASTLRELDRHRAAGAAIVLVSGSFPAVLEPIAAYVGAERLLCSRPELSAGRFTGRLEGAPMIGEAKRAAVRALLHAAPAVDPARCFAYGDHISDLPMLSEVGHPVVVGGDPDLLAALAHGRALAGRGEPGLPGMSDS